ncbi:MAG: ATP-binding protein [Bacteroidales bacterium]
MVENALLLHNTHWEKKKYDIPIKRHLLGKLYKRRHLKQIEVITGIRRCGKSSLLKQYINQLSVEKDPLTILFVNFDDPNFSFINQHPEKIHDIIQSAEKLTQRPVEYLFLDEIQSLTGWEKYIKSVYDAGKFKKICITGSNSELLSGDYAQLLSGRYLLNQMYPLSLDEVLGWYGYHHHLDLLQNKAHVLHLMEMVLKTGTFPEVIKEEDPVIRHAILTSYYDSILIKDCVIRSNIREAASIKELSWFLFNNISAPFTYNSLSRSTGINDVSIKVYLHVMQEAFLLNQVQQFSFKLKEQIKSKRKIYTIDNGLIAATSLKFTENKGKMLENFVYAELTKMGFENIFMYNDAKECDFIVKRGNNQDLYAIQVAYSLTPFNREREIGGLKYFRKQADVKRSILVTFDQTEKLEDGMEVVPFYQLRSVLESDD